MPGRGGHGDSRVVGLVKNDTRCSRHIDGHRRAGTTTAQDWITGAWRPAEALLGVLLVVLSES